MWILINISMSMYPREETSRSLWLLTLCFLLCISSLSCWLHYDDAICDDVGIEDLLLNLLEGNVRVVLHGHWNTVHREMFHGQHPDKESIFALVKRVWVRAVAVRRCFALVQLVESRHRDKNQVGNQDVSVDWVLLLVREGWELLCRSLGCLMKRVEHLVR